MKKLKLIKVMLINLSLAVFIFEGANALAVVDSAEEAKFFGNIQCQQEVFDQFKTLRVTREWSRSGLRQTDGSQRLLSPTEVIGVWVEARVFLNKEVELKRVTEQFIETRRFDLSTCTIKKTVQKKNSEINSQRQQANLFFSDRDLRSLIKSHKRGVIYVWSPNMPYSYAPLKNNKTGIGQLKDAATKLNAHVTVLLEPNALSSYADEIVSEHASLGTEDLRKVESVEIAFRSAGNHYPVVLTYANGKISRFVYPGVSTTEEYIKYLQGQYNELR